MSKVASKSHPPRVNFASITVNNLGTVRKLNSVLFPIKYSEKFYADVLLPDLEDFCKLGELSTLTTVYINSFSSSVYYNDIPVRTFCQQVFNLSIPFAFGRLARFAAD